MAFKKGIKKVSGSGRKKGSQNKLTTTVKDCVLSVFNQLQSDPRHNLLQFAKGNRIKAYSSRNDNKSRRGYKNYFCSQKWTFR